VLGSMVNLGLSADGTAVILAKSSRGQE